MAKRKENTRIKTFNKLIKFGKTSERDILNLKIEDLVEITEDEDVQNIILLRECIKSHNTINYFNYEKTTNGEEDKNGK